MGVVDVSGGGSEPPTFSGTSLRRRDTMTIVTVRLLRIAERKKVMTEIEPKRT